MDPLPTPTITAVPTTTTHVNYPDSVESSPRSHNAEPFNEPLPQVPGAKLRLMCSYGGHIIPRPHDKSLCYIGGDTRIVVVDRHSSLSSLASCLSRTLLGGRPFSLKYQLPHEDLDSLVSVTTDEDLENMIEEYDRITSSSALAPSRIRLFLFCTKPETAASMGSLLDDAKSETWFVDALNGSGLIPRNLSDSATMGCLVNLDNHPHDLEAKVEGVEGEERENKQAKDGLLPVPQQNHHHRNLQDVQATMPDSPIVENGSSHGSSSSSPSMCNLPPIRVRVEDHRQKVAVEEQFAQMTFAQVVQKQDDGFGLMPAALPPLPTAVGMVAPSIIPAGGSSEHLNRVLSDDERSDQGVPVSFRIPPLPQPQPAQVQHKAGAYSYNLPSPDSVASDTSATSATSFSKPMYYQEQPQVTMGDSRAPVNPDTKCDNSVSISSQIQIQQPQISGYASPAQFDQQQQLLHASTHFIPQYPATTPLPMSSFYPVYAAPPSQQQPIDHQQQYPLYVMPVAQTQPYMSVQSNLVDTTATIIAPNHTPTANMVAAAPAAYKDSSHPPLYPTKAAAKPDQAAASVYRTAVTPAPPLIPIAASQFQQPYVGYTPLQHPSQSIAVAPAGTSSANYGYEYAKSTPEQVYYTQLQAAAPLASQCQTINPAAAIALADASNQLPTSNTMHQIGASQPL